MISVTYDVYATRWHIAEALSRLNLRPMLSFDTETRGVYTKKERKEATKFLLQEGIPLEHKSLALQVANSSGLSFPSLVYVTHFVFGVSDNHSVIMVCDNPILEHFIWSWLAKYPGQLFVHNSLFDLKLMYHRIQTFPQNYEDTALLAKSLINHVDKWKAKVGLKELMGQYYDHKWVLYKDYEPDNLKSPEFLEYAAIDGAATFKLWWDLREHCDAVSTAE